MPLSTEHIGCPNCGDRTDEVVMELDTGKEVKVTPGRMALCRTCGELLMWVSETQVRAVAASEWIMFTLCDLDLAARVCGLFMEMRRRYLKELENVAKH